MAHPVVERHWEELRAKANVINIAPDLRPKIKDGRETDVQAIIIYVSRKVHASQLTAEHLIPAEIEGIATDVVEFSAPWLGETEISRLHPDEQRKRLGLRERPEARPITLIHGTPKAPSGHSNLIPWFAPIQNQNQCGWCVAYGKISIFEALLKIARGDVNYAIKLSEAFAFFCTPGASCDNGTTPEELLNELVNTGTVPEDCLPSNTTPAWRNGTDGTCAQGACLDYQSKIVKLKSWAAITDPTEQRSLLDSQPLNATMAVHQSFLNYTGPGIYKNLGPSDPIIGYHDVACPGYDDPQNYRIVRNSWDITWGQKCVIDGVARPGYCLIDAGELDPVMYELAVATPSPVTYTATFSAELVDLTAKPNVPVAGAPITINIAKPDGTSDQADGTTGTDGAVTVVYQGAAGAGYQAAASYAGKAGVFNPKTSNTVTFDLGPEPNPAPPSPPAPAHDTGLNLSVAVS